MNHPQKRKPMPRVYYWLHYLRSWGGNSGKNLPARTVTAFGLNQNIFEIACSADLPSIQGEGTLAFCTGACSCDATDGRRTVKNIDTTAWKKADACSPARWCSGACCISERSTTASKHRGAKLWRCSMNSSSARPH